MRKHTIEYVKSFFEEHECELLETEYINSSAKMSYKCACGEKAKISFNNLKSGQKCKKCGLKKASSSNRLSSKIVKQFFEEQGCRLLENKYINNSTKMRYRCSCGNVSKISYDRLKRGGRCSKCAKNRRANKLKHTLEFVTNYFEEQGCELLESKYINSSTKMKYRCSCKDISKISFANFKKGNRCKKCGFKKITGKNNGNYNPSLTDKERMNNRFTKEYIAWRQEIYKKNNYICQKCTIRGYKLNAHHIESWASNEKLRLKKCNGITFCEKCHKLFHKKYGKKNNNKKQLKEFLTL